MTVQTTVPSSSLLCSHDGRAHLKTPAEPLFIQASPYLETEHLLDLNTLDIQSRLFALALRQLHPATERYATVKYEEALDLEAVMARLRDLVDEEGLSWMQQEFYVVEFRSKLKVDVDHGLLFQLDKESHREATGSGGLLKYWYGVPDADRRNLATCFWRHKDDAILGGRGPWHKQARSIIPKMYEEIDVKGLRLIIHDNLTSWSLEPYR